MAGELIGVVNAKIISDANGEDEDEDEEKVVEGLGFAIPIDTAIVSINHLIKLGYIPGTPSLGVEVEGYKFSWSEWYFNYFTYMPYVTEAKGALQVGDYIYSVNGTVVCASDDRTALALLRTAIRAYEVGDKVELIVLRYNDTTRGYEETKVEITLIEYVPIEPQS